jgi:hypothetical protein
MDLVSTEGCTYIAQFLDAIRQRPQLAIPKDSAITLYQLKDGQEVEIDVGDSPADYVTGNSRRNPLIVKTTAVLDSKLDYLEQEIMQLENSEEYKTLAHKNRAWALPKPTEQEKCEWQLLKEKLADLKKKEDFYQKAILSTNAHSVKKSDQTRKGYKKDTAIKDERLLLSDVAITMWERFQFDCAYEDGPSFGDLKRASGFSNRKDVFDYFAKRAKGQVKKDDIKESLTEEEWILLIGLNQRVNPLLHSKLNTNRDGSVRLVLEHDVYEDKASVAENIVQKLYGPEKKIDIKDAASDSSNSP